MKSATEEIPLEKLPHEQRTLVNLLQGQHGLKPEKAWEGLHGIIVEFGGYHGAGRFNKKLLQKLVTHPSFRWLETTTKGDIQVGM